MGAGMGVRIGAGVGEGRGGGEGGGGGEATEVRSGGKVTVLVATISLTKKVVVMIIMTMMMYRRYQCLNFLKIYQ